MNSKATKAALVTSLASLVLCFTMLMGTTLAWFVDRVENTNNRIEAGSLEVDLVMYNRATGNFVSIAGGTGDIFTEATGSPVKWYPGRTETVYLGVRNKGTLPITYTAEAVVNEGDLLGALTYTITPLGNSPDFAVVTASDSARTGRIDAIKTIKIGEGTLKKIIEDPNDPENQNETHYYAFAVRMIDNASQEYQNQTISLDITVNATQVNDVDVVSDEDVSVLSKIPDDEKVETLSATSWKFNEALADYDFFADFDYESEDSEDIFPAGCIISDGENEYEFSGFEFTEREKIKLLTAAPVEPAEQADASKAAEEAEKSDLVFVYYEKETDEENDTESEETANGWYLLELESLQTALADEAADLADLIKDKELIKDAEKLPVISFADEESNALKNEDIISWLYQSAQLQIQEETE